MQTGFLCVFALEFAFKANAKIVKKKESKGTFRELVLVLHNQSPSKFRIDNLNYCTVNNQWTSFSIIFAVFSILFWFVIEVLTFSM